MAAQSDLLPENVSLGSTSVAPGASLSVNWLLANQGAGAANAASTTELRINQSSTSFAGTDLTGVSTAALAAGTSASQSTTLTAPTTPGTYYVWVIADNFNAVSNQSSTTNDEAHSVAFTVAAAAQSDLLPENVSLGSTTVAPGASLSVNWLLANQGAGAANAASTTELRINQSSTSFAGTDLTGVSTAALAAGTSASQSTTLTAPTTPGTYYVWVIADNFNAVSNQSSTTNDEAHSVAFTVAAQASTDTVIDKISTTASLTMNGTTSGTIDATPEAGSAKTSFDHDWFKVTLTAGHSYTFSAVGTSGTLNDVAIDLRDSSGNPLGSVVDGGANGTATFTATASTSGSYFLAISAGGSSPAGLTGNYQITTTDNGAPPVDTVIDKTSTAANLTMNGATTGTIDAKPETGSANTSFDHDWFKVTLTAGHSYTFSAVGTSGTLNDVAIDLRDSSGNLLGSVVDGGTNGTATFTATASTSGTYFLAISAGGSSPASLTGNYQIATTDNGAPPVDTVHQGTSTTTTLSDGATVSGTIDAEPMSTDIPIALPDGAGGYVDKDWYQVTLAPGELYTFSGAATSISTGLMDISLYSSDGTLTRSAVEGGSPSFTFDTTNQASSTQTYYVAVSAGGADPAWKTATGGYTISLAGQVAAPSGDQIPETNQSSVVLQSGTTYGTIDASDMSGGQDDDYYKVTLTGGDRYSFVASAGVSNSDTLDSVIIRLRDSNGDILASGDVTDAGPNPSFSFTAPGSGAQTYYLAISASSAKSTSAVPVDQKTGVYSITLSPLVQSGPQTPSTQSTDGIWQGFDSSKDSVWSQASQIAMTDRFVGVYLGNHGGVNLSSSDVSGLLTTNPKLELFSIFETGGMGANVDGAHSPFDLTYFTERQGESDGRTAHDEAEALGQPAGTAIYFGIDVEPWFTNAPDEQTALADIKSYLQGVQEGLGSSPDGFSYKLGVYGAGDTLRAALNDSDLNVSYTWEAMPFDSSPTGGGPAYSAADMTQTRQVNSTINGTVYPIDPDTVVAGHDFGQWNPDTVVASDSLQAAAVTGDHGLFSVQGSSTGSGADLVVGAQGTNGVVSNGLTGDIQDIFTQFSEFLFDGGSQGDSVRILPLSAEGITNHTVFLNGNGGDDILDGSAADTSVVASGGNGNDVLYGGAQGDVLGGDSGNDTLSGGAGNDTLSGGDIGTGDVVTLNDQTLWDQGDLPVASTFVGNGGTVDYLAPVTLDGYTFTNLDRSDFVLDSMDEGFASSNGYVFDGPDMLYVPAGGTVATTDTIRIQNGNGNTFSAQSIDLDTLSATSGVTVTFTGVKTDGSAVSQTFDLDDVQGTQTFQFNASFVGLSHLDLSPSANVIFDNMTLAATATDNDSIDGGAGIDTVDYSSSTLPVTVNLSLTHNQATGADIGTDQIANVENIIGSNSSDTLTGSSGNNVIEGLAGDDVLKGGSGTDTASYEHATAAVTVSLAKTTAQNTGGAGTDTLTSFENLTGSDYDDMLIGTSGNNVLTGLAGSDTLNGGSGADHLLGGVGDDTYVVDNSGDVVDETGGDGTDTVQSSVTFSLSDGAHAIGAIENLTLTGSGAINGTGNGLDNAITGNSGNNVLAGLGGADLLDGGTGTDTATYAASTAGVDVSLTTGVGSGGDAEGDTLVNIERLIGSSFDDTLEGSAGNNVLAGGANGVGGDMVSYEHAAAGVVISLATTSAQNTVGSGTDTLTGFENITGSSFNDKLTGTGGANVLTGLDGNDTLKGGAGADTLIGGDGDDVLTGGTGSDTFVFDPGFGHDTVTDYVTSGTNADLIDIDHVEFTDWAHLLAASTQSGSDVLITADANDTILLKNTTLAALQQSQFQFT